jgi:dolichyl-phosphate beta-glucosyltransferase
VTTGAPADPGPTAVSIIVPCYNEEARIEPTLDELTRFKMFTVAAIETIFPLVRVDGWAFDIEVRSIARARGLRIVEVPIEWHYRRQSRLNLWRDGAAMFGELLSIRRRARRGYP